MELADFIEIKNLEILASKLVQGFLTGLHKSPFHGYSVEFAEYRSYLPGDSLKHVDWKLYGRTDKLFLKKFDDETNLRASFLVDVSGSMNFGPKGHSKLKLSTQLVAGFLKLLQAQRDAFGVSVFAEGLRESTELKSTSHHFQHCLGFLENWGGKVNNPGSETSVVNTLEQHLPQLKPRSLVVLISDAILTQEDTQALADVLAKFAFYGHELMWIQPLFVEEELHVNLPKEPLRLVDLESGMELKTQVNDWQKEVSQELLKEQSHFKELLLKYGVDHHFLNLESDISRLFLGVLRKRSKILAKK